MAIGTSTGRTMVSILLLLVIAGLILIGWTTGKWVWSASALGLVFGFLMQRAGFCGTSILGAVILERDVRGVLGVALAIGVAMLGFALLAVLGLASPNPKPLSLLPAVIGGLSFGVGMVLAGGCFSGCLFKAGEGRLTSMVALPGMAIGIALAVGPLADARQSMAKMISGPNVSASIDRVLGLSFPLVASALGLGLTVLVAVLTWRLGGASAHRVTLSERLLSSRWSYTAVGILIGVLGPLAWLSSAASGRNYPLGVAGGVGGIVALLAGRAEKVKWWLVVLIIAILAGSAVSAWMRRELRLRRAEWSTLVLAFVGGILVGLGATIANGCFVGHVLSGWALLSLQSLLFGVVLVLSCWATTWIYVRGPG